MNAKTLRTLAASAAFAAATGAASADTEYFWRGTAGNPVWDDTSPNWTLTRSDSSRRPCLTA